MKFSRKDMGQKNRLIRLLYLSSYGFWLEKRLLTYLIFPQKKEIGLN